MPRNRKHYKENKDKVDERNKQYYQKNKKERNEYRKTYERNRKEHDPEYKLHKNISRSVYGVLKNKKGGQSVLKHLPYTMEELREHIEKQFKIPGNEWMTWDNYGKYNPKTHKTNRTWNLDHITAHSKFHYKTMDCQIFRDCWALTNLQPLDSRENLSKGNR